MEPPKLPEEHGQIVVVDLWPAAIAARRLVMTRRRVLDAEEVVEDVPDIARGPMAGLTSTDVEQNDSLALAGRQHRLRRECESIAAVKVHAADDRLQRTGEAVGSQRRVARIQRQLREAPLEPCPSASKPVDQHLDPGWRNDLEPIAALGCRHLQSSGLKVSGTTTG
jgi:hypothetical protein